MDNVTRIVGEPIPYVKIDHFTDTNSLLLAGAKLMANILNISKGEKIKTRTMLKK